MSTPQTTPLFSHLIAFLFVILEILFEYQVKPRKTFFLFEMREFFQTLHVPGIEYCITCISCSDFENKTIRKLKMVDMPGNLHNLTKVL